MPLVFQQKRALVTIFMSSASLEYSLDHRFRHLVFIILNKQTDFVPFTHNLTKITLDGRFIKILESDRIGLH